MHPVNNYKSTTAWESQQLSRFFFMFVIQSDEKSWKCVSVDPVKKFCHMSVPSSLIFGLLLSLNNIDYQINHKPQESNPAAKKKKYTSG